MMARQREMSTATGSEDPAGQLMQTANIDGQPLLPEELESVAKRVRRRLDNMSADVIEIGCELQAVKQRLKHGQFLDWVEKACGLSARTAQLMMRAAEWAEGKNEIVAHLEPTAIYLLAAPTAPETVRREVCPNWREDKGRRRG